MLAVKIVLIWMFMVIAAIINGVFRDKVLKKQFDEKASLSLSGLVLSIFIILIVYSTMPMFAGLEYDYLIYIGVIWVIMTVGFELLISIYAFKKSFKEAMEVFDIKRGNLFIVVLIVTLISPYLLAVIYF